MSGGQWYQNYEGQNNYYGNYRGGKQQQWSNYGGGNNNAMYERRGGGGIQRNGSGPVVDMKSLQMALDQVEAGTGQIRQILNSSTFRPRLPGLTKIMSRFTKENKWQKGLEVFDALQDLRIRPDTTIANAAISACDKGGQWERALQIFKNMEAWNLERDAITYSAVISALAKGRQWTVAIEVFHHMCSSGIEADAVTCCSLITAMDKGGQWQLAEQVFMHMYSGDQRFSSLLSLEDDSSTMLATQQLVKQLTDSNADLSKMVDQSSMAMIAAMTQASAETASPAGSVPTTSNALLSALKMDTNPVLNQLGSISEEEPVIGRKEYPANSGAKDESDANNSSLASVAANIFGNGVPTTDTTNSSANGGVAGAGTGSGGVSLTAQDLQSAVAQGSFDLRQLRSALSSDVDRNKQILGQHSLPVGMQQMIGRSASSIEYSGSDPIISMQSLMAGNSPMNRLQRMASDAAAHATMGNTGGLLRTSSISSKKAAPNRVCCNALLASYARAKPPQWRRALRLLELMWECGGEVVPDIVSYNTVMKACSNALQLDVALWVYYVMKQRGLEPSVATYGTLISAASDVQAYETVMMVWEWLQQSGLECNTTCMNAYISALEKQDRWEDAKKQFQSMVDGSAQVPPSAVTFNTMMSACVRRGEPHHVKELFNTMFGMNIQPTIQSYNTLIQAYSLTRQWREAMELLKFIQRADVNVRAMSVTFNHVLAAISAASHVANAGEKDVMAVSAMQVVEQAKAAPGCEPDTVTYNTYITIMERTGKHPQALQAYEEMVTNGIKPDAVTAAAIIRACTEGDMWDAAISLFNSLKQHGIVPDIVVYNVSVTACAQSGAWQQGLQIFNEMQQTKIQPDEVTFHAMMTALKDAKEWDALQNVFSALKVANIPLTTTAYNILLSAYEVSGQHNQGTEVLKELLEADLAPDMFTMNTLLNLLCKSENWEKALEAFDWMQTGCGEFNVFSDEVSYRTIIDGLLRHKQFQKALEICKLGHEKGVMKHIKMNGTDEELGFVDLHGCSEVSCLVVLLTWCHFILKIKGTRKLTSESVKFVTGWGRNNGSGISKVKESVTAFLEGRAYADVLKYGSDDSDDVNEAAMLFPKTPVQYSVKGQNPGAVEVATQQLYQWLFEVNKGNMYAWLEENKIQPLESEGQN
eukprot:TRINITY_DN239_c2_g2_i1.p1 TRINITY_DN239_c2_g2~~TRINITY_DN239_c2_g2_i1.p1  ORF type:complete len:1156 (+),score=193.51 TRINITY_DN239_c2_g2_i1:471-3938(+)